MPKLVFFSALDEARRIRGAIVVTPRPHRFTLKILQQMAGGLDLLRHAPPYVAVCGPMTPQGTRPWLVLTDIHFPALSAQAIIDLKEQMSRLLAYSDCLEIQSPSPVPHLLQEEKLQAWEDWFRHLPRISVEKRPDDPLEIKLRSPRFLWGMATVLFLLGLLGQVAEWSGSSVFRSVCYLIKLILIGALYVGILIIPVFGGLTEQARTLALMQAILFLSLQTVDGNLWSKGAAEALLKMAALFLFTLSIGKAARFAHDSILQTALLRAISGIIGLPLLTWLLFYSLH
ncbi:MAG: hypothetical protein V4710_11310 [Verrucomicrobiota bacterium]